MPLDKSARSDKEESTLAYDGNLTSILTQTVQSLKHSIKFVAAELRFKNSC